MTSDTVDLRLAVAVYGFLPRRTVYEEAGIVYESRVIRDRISCGLDTLPVLRRVESNLSELTPTDEESRDEDKDFIDPDNEKYERYLMRLNPAETKHQDHYKVLGLSKLRWRASTDQIRVAYRQKVLKHHPDKRKHKGLPVVKEGEDYFTCITKAYEQLGMSETKRRAYDSVDPKFDDDVPSASSLTPDSFYEILAPVFERNSRWSTNQPVPQLGQADSSREEVEKFYDFWFDFTSWREFSYLDEEDKEKGEDRWERREMDKINKAERERRRKNEAKRIRSLVDTAYSKDPRIALFKKQDAQKKEEQKNERQRLAKERKMQEEEAQREKEKRAQEKAAEEERLAKVAKEEEKKRKEAEKKALANQRRCLKKAAEAKGYWTDDPTMKLQTIEQIERLCIALNILELTVLNNVVEEANSAEAAIEALKKAEESRKEKKIETNKAEDKGKENVDKSIALWTNDEIQLLVKAANLFPSGTVERWKAIADYVNEHRKNKDAPKKNEKQVKAVQAGVVKPSAVAQHSVGQNALPQEDEEDAWSAEEQSRLEAALRANPATDPARWDKIATAVATKNKKACIKRFKFLAQMVKNKKAAE